MNLVDQLSESCKAAMVRRVGDGAVAVTGFEDYTYYGGYCETCGYEEQKCTIAYRRENGTTGEYEYSGTFVEFLEELLSA